MKAPRLTRSIAGLLLSIIPLTVSADTLRIPVGTQGVDDGVPLPRRGDSQMSVLQRFGLADEEHASVGQPPITRWDYREFTVYFENRTVIDSVRSPGRPKPEEQ